METTRLHVKRSRINTIPHIDQSEIVIYLGHKPIGEVKEDREEGSREKKNNAGPEASSSQSTVSRRMRPSWGTSNPGFKMQTYDVTRKSTTTVDSTWAFPPHTIDVAKSHVGN